MDARPHIASLDGLRGLAAMAVVIAHLEHLIPGQRWSETFSLGNEAVALFFSLSGFLMAYLYGDRRLDGAGAKDYLLHRFARIYPVYLVAVLVVAILTLLPLDFPQPIFGAKDLARHIFLLGSTGVFWSIPPEIQFYVFFLLLWFWFEHPLRRLPVAAGIATLFALLWSLGFPGPGILLTSKISYFLLGALAGRLFGLWPLALHPAMIGPAALVAVALHFLCFNLLLDQSQFWGVTSALTATLAVILVAREGTGSRQLFASAPLRFIGRVSFSLYLFHMPVMVLVSRLIPAEIPIPARALLMVGSAVAFAGLSQRYIEVPSRRALVALAKRPMLRSAETIRATQ